MNWQDTPLIDSSQESRDEKLMSVLEILIENLSERSLDIHQAHHLKTKAIEEIKALMVNDGS